MIHVQIASQITTRGVHGVRWVLVETVDAQQAAQPAPAVALALAAQDAAARAAPPVSNSTADALRLGGLKALVVTLGLGAALWTAAVQVGPPTLPALARQPGPAAVPPQRAAPAERPSRLPDAPAAAPPGAERTAPAAPAPPASGGLPRLTAAL
jgi:hypothetical protein